MRLKNIIIIPLSSHSVALLNSGSQHYHLNSCNSLLTGVLALWSCPAANHLLPVTRKILLFSHSVVSDSLWSHGLQHTRFLWPSLSPGVYPNSCPLSWWCDPTILSSVIPFSSCLHSFPASGSFQMSQLFASGGQSIGVSASVSVLPMNIEGWFPLLLTGLISLQSKGLSGVFSSTTVEKDQFFHTWLLEKP